MESELHLPPAVEDQRKSFRQQFSNLLFKISSSRGNAFHERHERNGIVLDMTKYAFLSMKLNRSKHLMIRSNHHKYLTDLFLIKTV